MHLRVHYIIMWKFIGTILTNSSRDWRYSRPSKAIYFRFKPQFIEDKPPTVLVAQAVRDGNIYIFDKQVIEIPEPYIFKLEFPEELGERVLAFKKIDSILRVDIEAFEDQSLDKLTAIKRELNEFMTNIYSRGYESNLTPMSGEKSLNAGVIGTVVEKNYNRAYFTIRVGGESVTLFADKDEQGNGINVIEVLAPGEVFNLPIADGIYRGDIYALSEHPTTVTFTEFTK